DHVLARELEGCALLSHPPDAEPERIELLTDDLQSTQRDVEWRPRSGLVRLERRPLRQSELAPCLTVLVAEIAVLADDPARVVEPDDGLDQVDGPTVVARRIVGAPRRHRTPTPGRAAVHRDVDRAIAVHRPRRA